MIKSAPQLALAALLTTAVFGATPPPAAAPASLLEAITQGKPSVQARLRYESVDLTGAADAEAVTARVRLGLTTKPFQGFQAMVEGEAVTPLLTDYFDGTGTNAANYAPITDPEVYNLNQAWVAYTHEKTKGTLGRQKLVLDNARFVGDVGWRQNDQTFDAFILQDKSFAKTTLTYAYLDRINRIFDASGVQPDWQSNSHLFHVSRSELPLGTLTGYVYLLDFDAKSTPAINLGVRNNSNATYGVSLVGARPVTKDLKATYRIEFATQSDYGDSTLSYDTTYAVAELGAAFKTYTLTGGYEFLGSDNGVGFKTPLATLHAFNGWADVFLATPAAGLTDTYIKAGAKVSAALNVLAAAHAFGTDNGASQLGHELDFLAAYKLNARFTLTAKFAKFYSDQAGFADRTKLWLQVDFAY